MTQQTTRILVGAAMFFFAWGCANEIEFVGIGCFEAAEVATGSASSITSAGNLSCARFDEGGWKCWGIGDIGNGTPLDSETPVTLDAAVNGTLLDIGEGGGVCTLVGGEIRCWGGGLTRTLQPGENWVTVSLPEGAQGVSQLKLGDGFACALTFENVYCWGANNFGQLGRGNTTADLEAQAVSGFPGLTEGALLARLAVGSEHACVSSNKGDVFCWGKGEDGRLGNGDDADQLSPVSVDVKKDFGEFVFDVPSISAGLDHTCAVVRLIAGYPSYVYCWGRNNSGQLGTTDAGNANTPQLIGVPEGTPLEISCGNAHTCVTQASKTSCWGNNLDGQAGQDHRNDTLVGPGEIATAGLNAVHIATGTDLSCASGSFGVKCWGYEKKAAGPNCEAVEEEEDDSKPDGLGKGLVVCEGSEMRWDDTVLDCQSGCAVEDSERWLKFEGPKGELSLQARTFDNLTFKSWSLPAARRGGAIVLSSAGACDDASCDLTYGGIVESTAPTQPPCFASKARPGGITAEEFAEDEISNLLVTYDLGAACNRPIKTGSSISHPVLVCQSSCEGGPCVVEQSPDWLRSASHEGLQFTAHEGGGAAICAVSSEAGFFPGKAVASGEGYRCESISPVAPIPKAFSRLYYLLPFAEDANWISATSSTVAELLQANSPLLLGKYHGKRRFYPCRNTNGDLGLLTTDTWQCHTGGEALEAGFEILSAD